MFESVIVPGVFWAEEPKYHGMDSGSFSQTRSRIVGKVIQNNLEFRGPDEFVVKVNENLKAAGVDPDNPHRHLKPRPAPLGPRPL